ncbi:hypothetical protein HPB48_015673 [Haemaphysalis longicornis]|uniref:THAP-type domain-containing protein n=1 Tax=Haemaphysalis longicornis TaxID=44386 RepID=A0A9J6G9S0_HAELO|nr:hypothetical protein HPB48_015673 [Haemaphysalis longicornis]
MSAKKHKSNRVCCVPQSSNYAVKGATILHSFPLDVRLKKEWIVKLRIGKAVTKPMKVCSSHFCPEDFFWSTTESGSKLPVNTKGNRPTSPQLPSEELEEDTEAVSEIDLLKTERSVLERVVLVLVRLKTFLSFKCLATLFGVSETTVHRYFYSTLRTLAAVMESAVPWPTKTEVQQNEPHCFAAFTDVRIVLDCTEVEVEKSHCASCRILTYSHYKGVHTLKVLIGVSPGALITFVSDCFGGRASDKACVMDSDVLNRLEPFKGDVMVDKGYNIDRALGTGVIQPPFLRKQQQFTREDALKTVHIARARVHVKRAIQ